MKLQSAAAAHPPHGIQVLEHDGLASSHLLLSWHQRGSFIRLDADATQTRGLSGADYRIAVEHKSNIVACQNAQQAEDRGLRQTALRGSHCKQLNAPVNTSYKHMRVLEL